jgi:hypothetical protein
MNKLRTRYIVPGLLIAASIMLSACSSTAMTPIESTPSQEPPTTQIATPVYTPETIAVSVLTISEYKSLTDAALSSLGPAQELELDLKDIFNNWKDDYTSQINYLEIASTSLAGAWENVLNKWNSYVPPQECLDYHNGCLGFITERVELSKSLVDAVAARNLEESRRIISEIPDLLEEYDKVIASGSGSCFEDHWVMAADQLTPTPVQETSPTPAPTLTPTATPETTTTKIDREPKRTTSPPRTSAPTPTPRPISTTPKSTPTPRPIPTVTKTPCDDCGD